MPSKVLPGWVEVWRAERKAARDGFLRSTAVWLKTRRGEKRVRLSFVAFHSFPVSSVMSIRIRARIVGWPLDVPQRTYLLRHN